MIFYLLLLLLCLCFVFSFYPMYVCMCCFVIGHYTTDLATNKIKTLNELKYATQIEIAGKITLRNVLLLRRLCVHLHTTFPLKCKT